MAAILIAKFVGVMSTSSGPPTTVHTHSSWSAAARCRLANSDTTAPQAMSALYIIGVWESAEHIRQRWASDEMRAVLEGTGFPTEPTERRILDLHQMEPPL